MRPAVSELIEGVGDTGHAHLHLEEQLVDPGGPMDGQTVGGSGLRQAGGGLILVAIKHRDGRLAFDPEDDAPVVAGDVLITVQCRLEHRGAGGFGVSR